MLLSVRMSRGGLRPTMHIKPATATAAVAAIQPGNKVPTCTGALCYIVAGLLMAHM